MQAVYENGTVRVKEIGRFSPVHTFECGQCFRWLPDPNGGYTGVAYGKAANVKEDNGDIFITCAQEDFDGLWRNYFDLDRDYDMLCKNFCVDEFSKKAIHFGSGMRILRQEPFEALISFILSQCNNIKRIRGLVQALCKLAGRKIEFMGKTYDLFPTPGEIANLSLSDLQCIKAGYRTPYILEAAKAVLSGEMNFNKIKALSTDEGRREMMKLPGVGEKVADCFLLFGLSKFDAFPKDVWIKKTLAAFPSLNASRFGEFAGIAQQYLFYYARETGLDLESLNRERKTAASCV